MSAVVSFAPPAGDDPVAWVEPVLAAGMALAAPGAASTAVLSCSDRCVLKVGRREVVVTRPHTAAERADVAQLAASLAVDVVDDTLWSPRRAPPPARPRRAPAVVEVVPAPPVPPDASPVPEVEAPPPGADPDELPEAGARLEAETPPPGVDGWARASLAGTWEAGATRVGGAAELAFGLVAGPVDLGLDLGGRVGALPGEDSFRAFEAGVVAGHTFAGRVDIDLGLGLLGSFRSYTLASGATGTGAMAVADEVVRGIQRVIDALPEELREVILLCDVEERPDDAVAAILDIPVGTAKSRLRRARARFRQIAERQGVTVEHLLGEGA